MTANRLHSYRLPTEDGFEQVVTREIRSLPTTEEDDYGLKRRQVSGSSGLCVLCKEDAALDDDLLCRGCRAELEWEQEKDPK